jgi:hypothetical protein
MPNILCRFRVTLTGTGILVAVGLALWLLGLRWWILPELLISPLMWGALEAIARRERGGSKRTGRRKM